MSEIRRIHDQLKRSFEGGAWHGSSVRELLAGVTAARAAKRPIRRGHTIWEIVLHMATWKSVVARRIRGEVVSEVPERIDWPPVATTTPAAWKKALATLEAAHQELRDTVAQVTEDELDQRPYPKASSRYVQIHGIIQHDLYHAGQIALLKKS